MSAVLGGRAHRDTELGTEDAALIVRAIPLRPQGDHIGALVLLRDVTDLRRRDRELVTKDATIREIHHRVKNNLQTVAALLRLQARRIESSSAKSALEEAVRRVGSIAIVHETLSQAVEEHVDFDEIADRLGSMVTEVSAVGDSVRVRREGAFGVLNSGAATALAMVLTEVLQNAVQHGYAGDAAGGNDRGVTPPSGRAAARHRRRRRSRAAGRVRPRCRDQPGLVDRADPRGVRARRTAGPGSGTGGSGTRVEVDVPLE